jgi:hypothetical protein
MTFAKAELRDITYATADLIGRSGATELQIGYLDENVPSHLARWYATARYRGTRITADEHTSPQDALTALARQVLEHGQCQGCGGVVTLTPEPITTAFGRTLLDGNRLEVDPSTRTCMWVREGRRWEMGCRPTSQWAVTA